MGPSGSGKTTLLNLIAGSTGPTTGAGHVAGDEIAQLSRAASWPTWRARHIGFIFQFYNLIPVLTACENVELPLLLTPLSAQERREHVRAALELVGLADRMQPLPAAALGRPGAAGGDRPRHRDRSDADPGRDEPTGDLDRKSRPTRSSTS